MATLHAQIADLLRRVNDPELGINIVDLGLIYGLDYDDGDVTVTMSMTTPACPLNHHIKKSMREVLTPIGGIDRVHVDIVWNPAWSPAMMHPDVRPNRFRAPHA